jgi:hypothetical protein
MCQSACGCLGGGERDESLCSFGFCPLFQERVAAGQTQEERKPTVASCRLSRETEFSYFRSIMHPVHSVHPVYQDNA